MHFFIRKTLTVILYHILLQTSCTYTSTCMLVNCSCFYCRLLTFFKIKFLQINHRDHYQTVKQFGYRSRRHSVVFIRVQTVCERLLADDTIPRWHAKSYNRFNILSHIGRLSTWLYIYHKYSDTLNTFQHAMPFKQSKSNTQMIWLESVLLSNAKWDTFIPSKVFNSFVELSVLYYLRYM